MPHNGTTCQSPSESKNHLQNYCHEAADAVPADAKNFPFSGRLRYRCGCSPLQTKNSAYINLLKNCSFNDTPYPTMTHRFHTPNKSLERSERVMLAGLMLADSFSGSSESRERAFQAALAEAAELVRAAGGELVRTESAKRDRAHSALMVGSGKAEEWAQTVQDENIDLVVFNNELTPTQERNLEKILQCRVLDRVGLILAIFARRAQSQEGRKARLSGSLKTFAIVGYTNAGKSSLFNRLTKADVLAQDQLFATLDTTARRLYLAPEASLILTDTVGFVRDLPHGLVAAFSATLEETALADVLLHVVDAANPDHLRQIDDVNAVLAQIGAEAVPQLLIYNKTDLLPADERHNGITRRPDGLPAAVRLSVQSGDGLDSLRQALIEWVQAT